MCSPIPEFLGILISGNAYYDCQSGDRLIERRLPVGTSGIRIPRMKFSERRAHASVGRCGRCGQARIEVTAFAARGCPHRHSAVTRSAEPGHVALSEPQRSRLEIHRRASSRPPRAAVPARPCSVVEALSAAGSRSHRRARHQDRRELRSQPARLCAPTWAARYAQSSSQPATRWPCQVGPSRTKAHSGFFASSRSAAQTWWNTGTPASSHSK